MWTPALGAYGDNMFDEQYIKTEKSTMKKDELISKYSKSIENQERLRKCSVLMLPIENFRKQESLTFYEGFRNLYFYLQDKLGKEQVDLCIDKGNIKELSLHSDEFRLGIFLLESILAPTFVGLLVDYLKTKIFAKKDDIVSVDIILSNEKKSSNDNIKISYKGSPDNMEKELLNQISTYDKNGIIKKTMEQHKIDVLS